MISRSLFHFGRFNQNSPKNQHIFCRFVSDSSNSPLKRGLEDVEKLLESSSPDKNNVNQDDSFATTAYPTGTVFSSFSQGNLALRPQRNPQETSIILFPGQGTQYVGMGKDLIQYPIAKDMFDAASSILGYNLYKVCTEGPIEKLNETVYCQPAVVVTSLAAIERLKERNPEALNNCIATAGFSVGEISALVFAGAFNFERGIKLVKARAEAMQLCAEMAAGGMMTVLLGADSRLTDAIKNAKEFCQNIGIENPECVVANYLYPSAKVLAGHKEALEFIENNASEYKIRRISKLPVSGAFHTRLMQPAAAAVEAAIKKCFVKDPIISVHRNIDGKRYHSGASIAKNLPKQVYMPVKWEQTMHVLYERPQDVAFPLTFEVGPGKSLSTLLKKVNAKAAASTKSIPA